MKTKVHKNSLEAYDDLDLGPKQRKVLDVIRVRPRTNKQIAQELDWPINCVTGRVRELRDIQRVREGGAYKCPETGKSNAIWEAVEKEPVKPVSKAKAWDDYKPCPECNGSKKKKVYRTNSGDCREVVCDYCEGAGYI